MKPGDVVACKRVVFDDGGLRVLARPGELLVVVVVADLSPHLFVHLVDRPEESFWISTTEIDPIEEHTP